MALKQFFQHSIFKTKKPVSRFSGCRCTSYTEGSLFFELTKLRFTKQIVKTRKLNIKLNRTDC
jgi:hypothetical protein